MIAPVLGKVIENPPSGSIYSLIVIAIAALIVVVVLAYAILRLIR